VAAVALDGWSGLDGEGRVYAEAWFASGKVCCGLVPYHLVITVARDSTFDIKLDDIEYGRGGLEVTYQKRDPWSYESPAGDYTGTYAVACPFEALASGTGVFCAGGITFSCRLSEGAAASGRMTFAGTLANGQAFCGSSLLVRGQGLAELPLFWATIADSFGGIFEIRDHKDGRVTVVIDSESGMPCWEHNERDMEALSYAQFHSAYGSLIDPTANWDAIRKDYYGLNSQLKFGKCDAAAVAVVGDVVTSADGIAVNGAGYGFEPVSLVFNPATGSIAGSFNVGGNTYRYAGVLTPGWVEGCDCGRPSETVPARPFAFGSWWFTSAVPYEDGGGETRSASVKIGDAVKIDVAE
jgi:hypothetical protein